MERVAESLLFGKLEDFQVGDEILNYGKLHTWTTIPNHTTHGTLLEGNTISQLLFETGITS